MPRSCVVLALLTALVAPHVHAASGGPDSFGYTWRDGGDGCDTTIPAFGPGAVTLPGVTTMQGPFSLGFTGTYYGSPVTQAWLSPSGYLTFSNQAQLAGPQPIPDPTNPDNLVAVYWALINTGTVSYESTPAFFHARWQATVPFGSIDCHLFVYPDGRLRMAWASVPANRPGSVGYENSNGGQGRLFYNGNVIEPGYPGPSNGSSLCILPPPNLDCTTPVVLTCGATRALTLPATATTPATNYDCSGNAYPGNEQVIRLDVTEPSEVILALSNPALDLIALESPPQCSEYTCLTQADDVLAYPVLYTGSYWFAVDKTSPGGGDAYTVNVTCDPISVPLACGASTSGDTTRGRTLLDAHPACRPGDYSGAESYYRVTHAGGNLLATLTGPPAQDVFILDANDSTTCYAAGDTAAAAFGLPAGDYLVVVDGPPGSEAPFVLDVDCGTQLSCASMEPVVLTCGSSVAGDTAGGASNVRVNACGEDVYPGPERVHAVDVPAGTTHLTIELVTTDDLAVFVLGSCDEGDCEGGGRRFACTPDPVAGRHFVVVDSAMPAGGSYTLRVTCETGSSFDRWLTCTNPRTAGQAPGCGITNPDGTTASTTAARMWSFDDGAFCVTNPGHKWYQTYQQTCAAGACEDCRFAMYVVAECGTSMNIPLCDNETGDIQIWDVFSDRYVDLAATSQSAGCAGGPWSASGTRIQWQDCAGSNCFWNTVITSVSFRGNPTLCGVYRLEFTNWGGFVWDLFANCSGLNEPGFMIYDNLCDAMEAFAPKPELSIVNPVMTGTCPNYTLAFDLHNTGCVTAADFCVRAWEEAVGGDVEHTDPALLCGLTLGPGEVRSFSVPMNLTAATSQALRLEVDPDDDVLECSEAATGSVVACGAEQGARVFRVPICGGCVSTPSGTRQPSKACIGDSARFDSAGSTVEPCVQGIQQAWTTAPSPPPPAATCALPDELDCWSGTNAQLVVPNLTPAPGERFVTIYLWTRCTEDTTCVNAVPYPLTVNVHRPPELGLTDASDLDPCQTALVLSWEPATFHHDPALGPGTYNVHRVVSTGNLAADCLAASNPANLIASDISATAFMDDTTLPNESYVYVIQAEDREPANPCLPAGPVRSGATAVACIALVAGAPALDEVDVLAPDPGVGNSLRATSGDEQGVAFRWADVRAIPGRDFFRVVRADGNPQGPFRLIADTLSTPFYDDRDAPGALYFYKIGMHDSCGNVAQP